MAQSFHKYLLFSPSLLSPARSHSLCLVFRSMTGAGVPRGIRAETTTSPPNTPLQPSVGRAERTHGGGGTSQTSGYPSKSGRISPIRRSILERGRVGTKACRGECFDWSFSTSGEEIQKEGSEEKTTGTNQAGGGQHWVRAAWVPEALWRYLGCLKQNTLRNTHYQSS